MKLMNYMNLNVHPVQLSFFKNRTHEFEEIFHAHQGMELLIVHEGRGIAIIEQQIVEMTPGAIFCFRPFQLHRLRMYNLPQESYVRSLFVLEPAVLEAALAAFPSLQEFLRKLWKDPLSPQSFQCSDLTALEQLFRLYAPRIEASIDQGTERLLEEQLLFLTAFIHQVRTGFETTITSQTDLTQVHPRKSSTTAERMLSWIEENYSKPFKLEDLAQAVHLTPNHVSATFRQSIGSTITEYLTARRIRQACWLLKTTDMSVQDIGEAVGLGNFSYFCQLFKKHVGYTPYTFKGMHRYEDIASLTQE
ncbi:helix-turn-helix transcriptional regulator [Paenibacillus sp. CGMCC 1.16610]|uniref:Helix-turn-helix domain-containing protein n=1 Tax=Paenibacillus anseongense TaxID=2682845 RepID=A0ABW9U3L5_9BACL|nr:MULTISPECIES: AraC family transcriptional regulator [Paenibacillus]MBA2940830.1 helix-turn-helix transcriptional regulator [Paenibacillus sp. CGMCC 1.16610]MVQ34013.1 helix-turn-helix domain-containing protein [Paenibacillus anseongense]